MAGKNRERHTFVITDHGTVTPEGARATEGETITIRASMKYAKSHTAAVLGIAAFPVEIETYAENGLPQFQVVGLPDSSVKESRERVQTAIKAAGFGLAQKKFTVNLAPADVRKEGSMFDLPIAIGVLVATGVMEEPVADDTALIGELAFDGTLRRARGVLPIASMLQRRGIRRLMLPRVNADEAAVVRDIEIHPVDHLRHAVEILTGEQPSKPHTIDIEAVFREATASGLPDMVDVKGQQGVKRAMEIAAAGGHNMIMVGPPGAGKTMLAKRLPSILPPLSIDEALETTTIHSVAGLLPAGSSLVTQRPFRAPHHTISDAALVGGGVGIVRAGEITLAHHGVLFLDELPEFQRNALEVLRQPLEDRSVRISRTRMSVEYPANVMLVCSMNPCPCGHFGSSVRECSCKPEEVSKYMSRISGPLLDRIDLHVDVPAVQVHDLHQAQPGEGSAAIRARVVAARERQRRRFIDRADVFKNADMRPQDIEGEGMVEPVAMELLRRSMERLSLSARAYGRILKVSRTIADLDGADTVSGVHMAEAVNYRTLDRPYWNG